MASYFQKLSISGIAALCGTGIVFEVYLERNLLNFMNIFLIAINTLHLINFNITAIKNPKTTKKKHII